MGHLELAILTSLVEVHASSPVMPGMRLQEARHVLKESSLKLPVSLLAKKAKIVTPPSLSKMQPSELVSKHSKVEKIASPLAKLATQCQE